MMCNGCWEDAGSPQISTLQVARSAFFAQRLNPFGALHVVIDDMNVDNYSVEFCMRLEDITKEEADWAADFLTMSEDERMSALALSYNLWGADSIHRYVD